MSAWAGSWWAAGAAWIAGALVLALAELVAPGYFLVFLAVGAAATGLVLVLFPAPFLAQVLLFAVFTGGAVALGRSRYARRPPSSDPLLNDRAARLVGKVVTVAEPIVAGRGRVQVGDGAWNATGPDLPAGTPVRIAAVVAGVLVIEPV